MSIGISVSFHTSSCVSASMSIGVNIRESVRVNSIPVLFSTTNLAPLEEVSGERCQPRLRTGCHFQRVKLRLQPSVERRDGGRVELVQGPLVVLC